MRASIFLIKERMRSLPLMTFICEELRKEKERQEEMKKVLRSSYNLLNIEVASVSNVESWFFLFHFFTPYIEILNAGSSS